MGNFCRSRDLRYLRHRDGNFAKRRPARGRQGHEHFRRGHYYRVGVDLYDRDGASILSWSYRWHPQLLLLCWPGAGYLHPLRHIEDQK
jgi:hypothetical protein